MDITAQIQLGLGRRRRSLESATCSSGPEVFVDTLPTISLDTFSSSDGSVDVDSREVAEDSWDDVDEACTLPTELEAGRYNYSVAIAASRGYGFGHAKFFERSRQSYGSADIVSVSDAGAHVVTVYPVITALSTQFSGSLGGQAVQITGRGFSETCTENVVELAGLPCQVVSCTTTAIVCTVANSSNTLSAGPYPGTTGLTERFWDTFPSSMDFAASLAAYVSCTPRRRARVRSPSLPAFPTIAFLCGSAMYSRAPPPVLASPLMLPTTDTRPRRTRASASTAL